ncbi:ATP-binding cassette domain-containing protein [Candidatus Bathyarchaeota archaeon]|nr:ATP-binding cassette domain-containing protein [Candidatus Bathyarchaeota archaeon]
MNSLAMIFKYWLKSRKKFIAAIAMLALSTVFSLLLPAIIGRLIGRLTPDEFGIIGDPLTVTELSFMILLGMVFALGAFIFNRTARILNADVASKAVYHIRKDIYDSIYSQSFAYFDKQETGQLVARATSDVEQTEMLFGFALNLGFQGGLSLIGVIIAVMITPFSWIFFLFIPLSLISATLLASRLKSIFLEARDAFGNLTNTLRENIVGSQVVRIFSTQGKEREKFRRNNERFKNASIKSVKYTSIFMPLNLVIVGLMYIAIFYFGGGAYMNGTISSGMLFTVQAYVAQTIFPLFIIPSILTMYFQSDAALTRVREVIDSAPDIHEPEEGIPAAGIKGKIEFNDVSFGYTPRSLVLKKISFNVDPGKKLAIIGTTGSGKSTIINLVPRFYDVVGGEILIDGKNVKGYQLKELRKQIGIVSQETFLFNRTIADNIRFGKEEAPLDEIINVAKVANIHDFITSLPEGYDTIVGERGMRLSGGQKQRLSIARALLINPKILIFDDSTSSVDVETEYHIQQALSMFGDTTTIIITQRVSTIRDADKILVLDKGRVVGLGTHEELHGNNALYTQIYQTLFQKQQSNEKKGGGNT